MYTQMFTFILKIVWCLDMGSARVETKRKIKPVHSKDVLLKMCTWSVRSHPNFFLTTENLQRSVI